MYRKENESVHDALSRLFSDPMVGPGEENATIADMAKCRTSEVVKFRAEWTAWNYAETISKDVGWEGSIPDLIRDALTEYAWASCELGRCTHESCSVAANERAGMSKRIAAMTTMAKRWSFLGVLANEGIKLTLIDGQKFLSEPRTIDPEIRDWIILHRAAIIAELAAAKRDAEIKADPPPLG